MNNNKGISMVELAIVLVIIGLLFAAVAEGVNIRKSSELTSFLSDISGFQVGIEGFDLKYRDLPGDMGDAFTYWDDGANGVCGISTECNGDANGNIDLSTTSGTDNEAYRAWQHLVLGGFLEGGYTGVATTANYQADIGINVPASRRDKVGYALYYNNTGGGSSRNEIKLGAFKSSNVNNNSAVTPAEALALDKKSDDGVPGTGIIKAADAADATATNCVNSSAYNTTITITSCIMAFPINPR